MRFSTIVVSAALPTLLAIACSSSSSSPATGGDASTGASSGTSGASGTSGTSGASGSSGTGDSGTSSGSSGTSGTSGASGGVDASVDAAPTCPTTTTVAYANCLEADAGAGTPGTTFIDFGASDAVINMVTGDYNAGTPSYYDPACIKIKAGHQVSWSGIFATHPLRPAPCNTTTGDQIPSISAPATKTTQSLTMTTPGTYGFSCLVHGTAGMNGVIVVY